MIAPPNPGAAETAPSGHPEEARRGPQSALHILYTIHIYLESISISLSLSIYIYIHIYIYLSIYLSLSLYIYIYIYMYCMHIFMCIHIYIYIYIYIHMFVYASYMSCDIHTHTPARTSSTIFLLYYSVLRICSANCLGHGHGYECHSLIQLHPTQVARIHTLKNLGSSLVYLKASELKTQRAAILQATMQKCLNK